MRILTSAIIFGLTCIASAKSASRQEFQVPKPKNFMLTYKCTLHIFESVKQADEKENRSDTRRKEISLLQTSKDYEIFKEGDIRGSISMPVTTTSDGESSWESLSQVELKIENTKTNFSTQSTSQVGQYLNLSIDDPSAKKLFIVNCSVK